MKTLCEYRGKKYSIRQLAELAGVPYSLMVYRVNNYKTIEECMKPKKNRGGSTYEICGKSYTMSELRKITGLPSKTIYNRLEKWGLNETVFLPRGAHKRYKRFVIDGKPYTIFEICEITGCPIKTVRWRLYQYGLTAKVLQPKQRG